MPDLPNGKRFLHQGHIRTGILIRKDNEFVFHPLIQNPANEVHWQG